MGSPILFPPDLKFNAEMTRYSETLATFAHLITYYIVQMRKFFIAIVAVLFAVLTVNAQSTTLEQESDTTINVVGYFCKNDTMTFRNHQLKQKITDNDTILTYDISDEFMIVVTDSTSKGYRMEYIPVSHVSNVDSDTLMNGLMDELWKKSKDLHCIFTTDELGQVQHIENWREIRDMMKKAVPLVLDWFYQNKPGLDSIISRRQFENMLLVEFSTESKIREAYDELDLLFGVHGKSFEIGQKELDDVENGYPQHIIAKVGYTEQEDDNDFEGDYAVMTKSVVTIPVEDAMDLGINSASLLLKENVADSLSRMKNDLVDSMKTVLKDQDVSVTQNEYYSFFFNGWPKLCYTEKIVDVGLVKNMELNLIEWSSRHWNIYETAEEGDSKEL